ncbi:hypothetical protein F5051DRAFT_409752 [Lentinula edodes]|nr:hypothetical protein F5051DRAFT_409752 [Lentinula edodes]
MNIQSLPTEYSFVALSLNPEATVSSLENEELTAACRRLQRKTFVALVGERRQFFMPWEPYHSWQFYLIFQGLREEDAARGIEPEMSVPILPNTTHPLCRQALDPGYALPWNDCYFSESIQFDARVATCVTGEEPVYYATSEEVERIQRYFEEDVQRRRVLRPQIVAVRAITGSTRDIEHNDAESEVPWASSFVGERGSMDRARGEDSASASSRKGSGSDARIMLDEMTARPHSNLVVVEVSYDLSSTAQIHCPDEFFKEIASLKR